MGFIHKLTNERFAKSAAQFMRFACYFVIFFFALCTVLSFMGRQTFTLLTKSGTFERAIYAEENHDTHSRNMTVHTPDSIYVWANDEDQIDFAIQVGLSLMYAIHTGPMILAFWFLSRMFSNIHKGKIFMEENATYLLYYGLLQCSVAVIVPFAKLLICWLTNLVSSDQLSIGTGQGMFSALISSIAFLVAAYIIHYGVHLQDEVDHTL